jgi:peptidoglycan/xylan/chitin deacetylase (PgdA/CDA1 family)
MNLSGTNFRADRFLAHLTSHHRETMIPILMYHSISSDPEKDIHPYYRINTSPEIFAAQMKFLYDNDYHVTDLAQISGDYNSAMVPADRKVVITFDDGYEDFYLYAFPIMQKYNFPATVFLPAGFIGNDSSSLKHNKRHLTWENVRALFAAGIEFGSHTVTHPQLTSLPESEIEKEIKLSREIIEDKLGEEVVSFSYPFRFPDEKETFKRALSAILEKYGYSHGVSTRIGRTSSGDDKYFRKRIPVNSADDISLFAAKLGGGYDWLYPFQHLSKLIEPDGLSK